MIRGSVILEFAKRREGLPEVRFGGLFLLPVYLLILILECTHANRDPSDELASNSI
jgi:hypothetical protein